MSASVASGTPTGRWVVTAAVLGSGIAFLDGTVVNAALPAISRDLDAGLASLQWVLSGYLLALGSLLVVGGSLGDVFGRRRVFIIGLIGFALASLGCSVAQTTSELIGARVVQGVAAAGLVPGSLALISSSFREEDRGRAIGAWSGLAGVSSAIGPFLGGWLIDAASWRLVFLLNLPVAALTVVVTLRHVPESRDEDAARSVDLLGGISLSLGLAGVVYALIEGPAGAGVGRVALALTIGLAGAIGFVVVERRTAQPMVPFSLFASRQFTGANGATLGIYAALGIAMFLVVVHLQTTLGYSALQAGAAFLPVTVMMLLLSARMGALGQRIGPRLPMTVGPAVVAVGLLLLSRIDVGSRYVTDVLPGATVLGLGLAITVSPLTAAVLAAVDDHHAGVGSAINNAAARVASLLAIAVLPGAVGLDNDFVTGYRRALVVSAVLALLGGVVSWLTVERGARVAPAAHVPVGPSCHDPCVRRAA